MLYASEHAYFTSNHTSANYRQPCGWTKFRFVTDNPGLWLLHCHINAHVMMGMNVLFQEDTENLTLNDFSPPSMLSNLG